MAVFVMGCTFPMAVFVMGCTFPMAVHEGFNMFFNIAEATNYV
jgi:hypothetical protein